MDDLIDTPMIVRDPRILVGKPTIRGTRISVQLVLECLAAGWSREEILENYPSLTPESIRASLLYARDHLPPAQWDVVLGKTAAE